MIPTLYEMLAKPAPPSPPTPDFDFDDEDDDTESDDDEEEQLADLVVAAAQFLLEEECDCRIAPGAPQAASNGGLLSDT